VPSWGFRRDDGEHVPLAGDAVERATVSRLEADARADDEVAHGLRHQHLAGVGVGGQLAGDLDGDSLYIVSCEEALAAVNGGTSVVVANGEFGDQLLSAFDCPGGAVERGPTGCA
jgi:hypothetical protein